MEYCPSCYNARGPAATKARGIAKTDPAVLAEYGDGEYPLRWAWEKGEVAANGNFIQNNEIAKRYGICGDPEQVREGSCQVALQTLCQMFNFRGRRCNRSPRLAREADHRNCVTRATPS